MFYQFFHRRATIDVFMRFDGVGIIEELDQVLSWFLKTVFLILYFHKCPYHSFRPSIRSRGLRFCESL